MCVSLVRIDRSPKRLQFVHRLAHVPVPTRQERYVIGYRQFAGDLFPIQPDRRRNQVRNIHLRVIGHRLVLGERRHGGDVVPAGHQRLQDRVHNVPMTLARYRHKRQNLSSLPGAVRSQRRRQRHQAHRTPKYVHSGWNPPTVIYYFEYRNDDAFKTTLNI